MSLADWFVDQVNTGSLLLAGLRARLEGRTAPPQSWKPDAVRLIGGMRLQGGLIVMRHATTSRSTVKGEPVEEALDDLAEKMRRRWEREIEIDGFGRLEDRLADARLEEPALVACR